MNLHAIFRDRHVNTYAGNDFAGKLFIRNSFVLKLVMKYFAMADNHYILLQVFIGGYYKTIFGQIIIPIIVGMILENINYNF